MKIFLLERTDGYGYDEYDAKIIRAKDEGKARELANNCTGDEGNIWTDEKEVACKQITVAGEEGVVLASFNAG